MLSVKAKEAADTIFKVFYAGSKFSEELLLLCRKAIASGHAMQ